MSSDTRRENYGIGEWYGHLLTELSVDERKYFAEIQTMRSADRPDIPCPFQSHGTETQRCTKAGGVCSLRKYVETDDGAEPAAGPEGSVCSTCPNRFEENGLIYDWIGSELLGAQDPIVLGEIGFLEDTDGTKVGRIDAIVVHPDIENCLEWCALEKQAVYFSGAAMTNDFRLLREHDSDAIPYPQARRRPDFRSSGPKRLMPQLQIKVPTLRRWGRKMAVVVDQPFFDAMGTMETVDDISNGDIIWFVIGYQQQDGRMQAVENMLAVTTLETSVVGLTGGEPVSKSEFEAEILKKLPRKEA